MDRPHRPLAAALLCLTALAPGCRSTRNEVPPARPYASDGRQRKKIDFSSQGHPLNGAANAVFQPSTTPNMPPGLVPRPGSERGSSPFSAIPGPSFGAPGTSGLGEPPTLTPAPSESPSAPAPTLDVPATSQGIPADMPAPGVMGRPGDLPSPN